jgi:PAS domain S-box-containing protein
VREWIVRSEASYEGLKSAFYAISEFTPETPQERMKPHLDDIMKHESAFLTFANSITAQYDLDAKAKVKRLEWIELFLMLTTLTILFLEAFFIFRPAVKKIDEFFLQIREANDMLLQNQRDLETNIEELQSTEEELRQNMEELNVTYEQLQIKEDELTAALYSNKLVTDAILDGAPLLIMTLNLQGEITSANSALRELFGYNPDDIIGSPAFSTLYERVSLEADLVQYGKEVNRTFRKPEDFLLYIHEKKTSFVSDRKFVNKDGTIFPGRVFSKALFDEEEKMTGFIVMIEDISEEFEFRQKIAKQNEELQLSEKELLQNVEELQTTQELLQFKQTQLAKLLSENKTINDTLNRNIAVSFADPDGVILKVNDVFCQSSGYVAGELIGKNHNLLSSGYHDNAFWESMWKTIQHGNVWRGEIRNRKKNGEIYWVDTVINPVTDEYGKILQYLSIRVIITERKNYELAVESKNDELKLSLDQITLLNEKNALAFKEVEKLLKNVTDSIQYAKRIQDAIIPQVSQIQNHVDAFVLLKPKDIVSGDYYWFADKGECQILAVVDCTGHGVSGAFMTMIANNILNYLVHDREIYEPDVILNEIPTQIQNILHQSGSSVKDGMDIALVKICKNNNRTLLTYAGVKIPLTAVRDNELHEIKGERVPIGVQLHGKQHFYGKHEIDDVDGKTFYLYSDGYQDQFGGEHKMKFMSSNFKKLLLSIAEESLSDQKIILEQAIDEWKGETEQTDDILVIGFRL